MKIFLIILAVLVVLSMLGIPVYPLIGSVLTFLGTVISGGVWSIAFIVAAIGAFYFFKNKFKQ